jgi:uncharacterized cupin superfamily protein
VPVAASHGYYSSSCGQVSAGLWSCTAHETIVPSAHSNLIHFFFCMVNSLFDL